MRKIYDKKNIPSKYYTKTVIERKLKISHQNNYQAKNLPFPEKKYRLEDNPLISNSKISTIHEKLDKQNQVIAYYQSKYINLSKIHKELFEKNYDDHNRVKDLTEQNNKLSIENSDLNTKYQKLSSDYDYLSTKHNNFINKEIDASLHVTGDIVVKHHKLSQNYSNLVKQYKYLLNKTGKSKINSELTDKYHQLSVDYDALMENYKMIIVKHFH
ncbi:hypothetical protein QLL95_gp0076 [Cotonvirus japonicus]|uniref:Uncharacterized protein n=1 Tax=Cotonvirus japonicus TaxID=2811091 RepID=A0ABM7NQY3_9VIRU|nr:hypothetical protein QLL95_gp0076 [Cotonvirus japonicus]BCS82565.1 hypothetical protein [Cotonvirus japonicus]